MRAFTKSLYVLLAGILLASCGGGGGGDSTGGFTPQGLKVSVQTASGTSTPNSLVGITVRVNNTNDTPIGDGATVTLQVSPPGVGLVSTTQPTPTLGERATATTAGGIATFRLHTRAVGTATLTASVPDTRGPGTTVTATANVTVAAGAPNDPRLTIQATATTLPINPGVPIFFGSPYIADVTLTQRSLDGALVTTGEGQFGVAINPVTIAAFSTLDDGETQDVNEFEVLLGNGPVDAAGGRGTVFVHSFNQAGQAVLTVTAQDPQTGETVSAQQTFTVVSGATGLPGSVVIIADSRPVYIQGVNGPTSKALGVEVHDGAGGRANNPAAGVNNIQLELVGGARGGERLQAVGANGAAQSGALVRFGSNNGVGNATYSSGTVAEDVLLRATSDRADNNVDNGIQDGVTSTRSLAVSDGQLFDLQISTVGISDPVSDQVAGPPPGNVDPNATYRMLVTVQGQDRKGNPIPPNSQIRFGLVDEPQSNGNFLIAGSDGNPQENGTLFTAPGGNFPGAGGGVGAGDTLVVLAEDSPGNRDMEAARTVASVQSAGQLTVTQRFNPNDVTGSSVDAGPIFPYVIGRGADGSVIATGVTDSSGTAQTVMTYPASRLGKRVIIWAQGVGTPVNGVPRLVTDVETISFAAAGPAALTASPASIIANRSESVRVCLRDSSGNPVRNARIDFTFEGIAPGIGTIDNVGSPGKTSPTGADGCVVVVARASGQLQTGGKLVFSSSGAEAEIDIDTAGAPTLSIGPSPVQAFSGVNLSTRIAVCVNDAAGPIEGVLVSGSCTIPTPAGVNPPIVSVNVPATTTFGGCAFIETTYSNMIENAVLNTPPAISKAATCTFTAAGLTGTVQVVGARRCGDGLAPAIAGCPP